MPKKGEKYDSEGLGVVLQRRRGAVLGGQDLRRRLRAGRKFNSIKFNQAISSGDFLGHFWTLAVYFMMHFNDFVQVFF